MLTNSSLPDSPTRPPIAGLALVLSREEFWFVLTRYSPALLLGIENPYLGWLAADVEAAQQAAWQSLLGRRLVLEDPQGKWVLDGMLEAIGQVCARPEHSLLIQAYRLGAAPVQGCVHFYHDWIVEQMRNATGQYRLTVIRNKDILRDYLEHNLWLNSPAGGNGTVFTISASALQAARQLGALGQPQAAAAALEAGGLSSDTAFCLAEVLTLPVVSLTAVLVANRQEPTLQHTRGLVMLSGRTERWRLHLYTERNTAKVKFIPVDAATARKSFFELLP